MLQSRTRAIQALKCSRCFSTSTSRPALIPLGKPANNSAAKVQEEAKREQSTAAAAAVAETPRPRPAPAFNRHDYDVQPLRRQQPEMDHSFVGMKGGEIFHEMMLRQNVKHICE